MGVMLMKISLIVPVYNIEEEYLSECLNSLKVQSGVDTEFIIVDDGSKKSTADYLDNYAIADERFHIIHKKNEGVSAARNTGMDFATGDYIGFVDGDDILEYDALKLCADTIQKTLCDMCVFHYRIQYPNAVLSPLPLTGNYSLLEGNMRDYFTGDKYLGAYVWRKIIRNDIALSARFENVPLQEDALYTWSILAKVHSTAYLDDALYRYRIRQGSQVRSCAPEIWVAAADRMNCIVQESKEENCLSTKTLVEKTAASLSKAAAGVNRAYSGNKRVIRQRISSFAGSVYNENRSLLTKKAKISLLLLRFYPALMPLAINIMLKSKEKTANESPNVIHPIGK